MQENLKNIDLEKYIISAILSGKNKLEEYEIEPLDFYLAEHEVIFEAFVKLEEEKKEIGYIQLKQKLVEMGKDLGAYALELIDFCYSYPMSYESACRQLKELSKKRKLSNVPNIISDELNKDKSAEAILNDVIDSILKINKKDDSIINLRDEIDSTMEEIDANSTREVDIGIKSGYNLLDRYITFRKGNFIVLGAKSSVGKTTLAVNMALNISKTKRVCYFSLEMNKQEMKYKMISCLADVEYWKIELGKLTEEEEHRVGKAIQSWEKGNMMLYQSCESKLTVNNIRTKCKNLLAGDGLDFVVVDYLQLLAEKGLKSKYEEITAISQKLKLLASELNIPILVLSQFSRAEKTYSDTIRKPTMFDFKDSGSIENDADIALLLYRSDTADYSKLNIIVAKNRLGAIGEIECKAYQSKSRIEETGGEVRYN